MLRQKEKFKHFVEDEDIENYVARKRIDGEWGDELEIQAFAELYSRRVKVFTIDETKKFLVKKVKTYHNGIIGFTSQPLRLSFYNDHYNSIVNSKN